MDEQNRQSTLEQNGPQGDEGGKVTIIEVIDVIADRIDPLLQLLKAFFEQSAKRQQAVATLQVKMTWIVLIIVIMIVGVSGALTYLDKIDGSTFTFLLGLVVGYVLTFIRDTIRPPEKQ